MATDTYGQNIPLPVLTDAPNAQLLGGAAGLGAMVPQLVMRFASATTRAATITSPVAGMVTWLTDVARLDLYDGTTWQTIVASTLPWADVVLGSAYQAWVGSTVGPRVRREGSIVYLEGRMMRKDSANIPASEPLVLGVVPTNYRPVGHYAEGAVTLTNSGSGSPTARIEVSTGGEISLHSDKASSFVGFSNWWFVT